jgi:osmoprotectant transport system ATP-binding protein
MISLEHVSKRFPGTSANAVGDLSLDIDAGEFVVLVGPSGCGKTTTMRMINRLIEPSSGKIVLDGRDVLQQDPVELRRGIGYVIQSIGLLPHRTVAQNIATVPELVGWPKPRVAERVRELLALFQLDPGLLERYPSELSGGQRQRVGVARALAADPPVMLMDEPFAAVDPIVRNLLQEQFLDIQERVRKTIVFVTHDIDEAIKLADRIAVLNVGGKVEQYATPKEILSEPASQFVKDFVGEERGLKRLALIAVEEIGIQEGPVAVPSASSGAARGVMSRFGVDWASVVADDGQLLGWVDGTSLGGHQVVSEVTARPFSATVRPRSSLREALDAIVTSRTNVAVVVDDEERYLGILTLELLSRELTK